MAYKVLLLKQDGYNQKSIDSAVENIFAHFGGVETFVTPGAEVLLKVNLVSGCAPDRRVTTDPSVVRAVARVVLEAGGHPVIADSPGIDNFERAARKAGLMDVARDLGVPCVELTDPVPLPPAPGAAFHKIEVSRRILESDCVVNLPKMKTHAQMLLTLGVKNLFGCVVGRRKAEWHYSVGLKRDLFAALLLDLWAGVSRLRAPRFLTILDGVIGMDGQGPTNGKPFPFGVLGGARDALTMDFWLCRMLGLPLEDYPLWQAALARNMEQCALDERDLSGDFPLDHVWSGVNIPRLDRLSVIPGLERLPFGRALEQALTSRPVHRPDRCAGCGKCAEICPAGAIVLREKKLTFNYKKCVRCYCCHEMCPVNAIEFRDGLMMKVMKFFGK